MFVKRLKAVIAALVCAAMWAGLASTAQALLVTTTGTTSGGSVSGSADFEIVGSTLEITLTNTTNTINTIAQILDGLSFTLIGGSAVTLSGASAAGFVDCTGGSCVTVGTFHDYHSNTNPPPPWGWTFSGGDLFAGNGSFKPAGIVNDSVLPGNGNGGPGNAQHNDLLLGGVEFDFSFTTPPTGVENVKFWWGTSNETTSGSTCTEGCGVLTQPAPEPGSFALFGLALSGLAWARRRLKR